MLNIVGQCKKKNKIAFVESELLVPKHNIISKFVYARRNKRHLPRLLFCINHDKMYITITCVYPVYCKTSCQLWIGVKHKIDLMSLFCIAAVCSLMCKKTRITRAGINTGCATLLLIL
jgi:hypothetical protein